MNEHAAHTQTHSESLSQPYSPVLSLISTSMASAKTEHGHAKRSEYTASYCEKTMVTGIEKTTCCERGNQNEKALGSTDESDESSVGVRQEMGYVV